MAEKRTAQALAELFGTPVSEGTVTTMTKRATAGLDDFLGVGAGRIAGSEVAGFDETGLRVAGGLQVHLGQSPYLIDPEHWPGGWMSTQDRSRWTRRPEHCGCVDARRCRAGQAG